IAHNGDGTKDSEVVDMHIPDPSYTPERPINASGDMMRDMQKQFGDRLKDIFVNVKLFGATLDGTSDDSDAFEEALLQATSSGKKLYIPNGTLVIKRPITINANS